MNWQDNGTGIVTVKQHGFTVASAYGVATPSEASPADSAQPSTKRLEVGFKGLVSICNASSLGTASPVVPYSGRVEVVGTAHPGDGVRRLVRSVVRGLKASQDPEAAQDGLGGTYFFMNEIGRRVGIMKPCDEEPLAPNNPKGFVGRQLGEPGLKPTVRVGEAAIREVAAYLLDHDGFARVPPTVLVRMTHPCFHQAAACDAAPSTPSASSSALTSLAAKPPATAAAAAPDAPAEVPCKLGSLQEFVVHECDTSEMGASGFSAAAVHRIGILDIRLLNTDRHAGNMLVQRPRALSSGGGALGPWGRLQKAALDLVPIDHGFCLPEALEPPFFEWLHWPQAMMPFDEEELGYIGALDAAADVELLRGELPSLREECLRTLEVATTLLKRCAAAGMTLAEIGHLVSRPLVGLDEEPSRLEKLCIDVRQQVDRVSAEVYSSEGEDEAEAMCWVEERLSPSSPLLLGGALSELSLMTRSSSLPLSLGASGALTTPTFAATADRTGTADDLVFDFDFEAGSPDRQKGAAGLGRPPQPTRPPAVAVSPDSDASASTDQLSPLFPSSARRSPGRPSPSQQPTLASPFASARAPSIGGGGNGMQMGRAAAAGAAQQAAALEHRARSVAMGGGLPWRPDTQRYREHRRRGRHSVSKAPRVVQKPAYPPPVLASKDGGTAVFHDLDGPQWECFMACLQEQIDEALRTGDWDNELTPKPVVKVGTSCPKF